MDDQVQNSQRPPRGTKAPPSALKTWYLVAYNSVSAVLWATVLGYAVVVPIYKGFPFVHLVANSLVRWTQTLAILEMVHSATGLVRAPFLTTLMQVWSRLALVWGAVFFYPSVARSPVYTTLLLAWSITEVVRYTYFALLLSTGTVPRFLFWLRYNMFYVLYPVGACSEMWLMWLVARGPGRGTSWEVPMYLLLAQYPIGFPKLFTHMIKQRRKVLSADREKKAN